MHNILARSIWGFMDISKTPSVFSIQSIPMLPKLPYKNKAGNAFFQTQYNFRVLSFEALHSLALASLYRVTYWNVFYYVRLSELWLYVQEPSSWCASKFQFFTKEICDLEGRVKIQPFLCEGHCSRIRDKKDTEVWQVSAGLGPLCFTSSSSPQQPVLSMEPQNLCHVQRQPTSAATSPSSQSHSKINKKRI